MALKGWLIGSHQVAVGVRDLALLLPDGPGQVSRSLCVLIWKVGAMNSPLQGGLVSLAGRTYVNYFSILHRVSNH